MQTTHKIPGDSAVTYAKYLTSVASRGDYYTRDGNDDQDQPVPSRWHGSAETLNSLGLSAEDPVQRDDLRAVMKGMSPLDGEPLRPAGSNGTRTAGVELMFAPPKSVSALWATSSPYRRAQIEVAHRRAVESALARTEREVALVRRKSGGVVRFERAKSLLAAEFVHTSSRLAQDQEAGGIPDPQLHSHLVVFAAERTDGKLAAVESRQLYKTARENGAWYRAELAANLRELGVPIERRTGRSERYFEVQGVPEQLASRWSTRSEDVDRAARIFRQRYGREPRAGELGSLTTSTRGSKSAADRLDVNEAWRAVGEEHGLSAERSEALFEQRSISGQNTVNLRAELLSKVTEERSMISDRELRAKAYELERRSLPARRGRSADRGPGAPGRVGPPRGPQLDDPPPARAGAGHGRDRRAPRQRERRPAERGVPQAGAPRDRRRDPRLADPRATRGAGDDHRPRRYLTTDRSRRHRQGRRHLRRGPRLAARGL